VTPAECVKVLSFAFTLLFLLNQTSLIFFVDRFKLTNFVGVIPPTSRALIIEVSSDVIPAKSANLVFALARFEVEVRYIHLLEAQGAFLRLLLIAPICVLYACKDRGFCLE
jgi:hypothetical protein